MILIISLGLLDQNVNSLNQIKDENCNSVTNTSPDNKIVLVNKSKISELNSSIFYKVVTNFISCYLVPDSLTRLAFLSNNP